MNETSQGIYFTGETGGTISWNNLSVVGGSSGAIMIHYTEEPILVHNNTVTGNYYEDNIWPHWNIGPGAYSVCAGPTRNVTFRDNHAGDGTTNEYPDYNITGEKLGGGWWPNVRAVIDTSEQSLIHIQGANVTLTHDTQMLEIVKDGVRQSMRFYNDGTSWAWFNKTDLAHHIVNVAPSNLYLTVYPADQAVNASFISASGGITTWNATGSGSAIATFTMTGAITGSRYSLYVDGGWFGTQIASSGTVVFNYSGSWSEHQFEIRGGTYSQAIVSLGTVIGIMMTLAIIVPVIVTVAQIANEKRKVRQEDIINMAIFIVVGVTLLTLVYALLP
jgi:hypothetical protein